MKFHRMITGIAVGCLLVGATTSIARAQCDPIPSTSIGDINGDGALDVLDVVGIVNISFRGAPPSRLLGSEDLNGDGIGSDVIDVVAITNIAFRQSFPAFPFRIFPLTGRSGPGARILIADDSIQYRFFGIYEIGEDRADLGTGSTPKTDTLRIQPGTDIEGDTSSATPAAFIIRRTGYGHFVGTASDPVVFTSMLPDGARDRGDWGGMVINGFAPNNNFPTYLFQAEGNGGLGGGTEPNDNSGCFKYMRVEFAGREFTTDNELNGITLNGVGAGTTMEYVQINQNADDGIEWFGGRCNVKHIVLSGCDDDGFDSDIGAQWKGQFLITIQDPTKTSSSNPNGNEWDNHPSLLDSLPRMTPTVWNMTVIGQTANFATSQNAGNHIRKGAACDINNTVWTKFRLALDIDNNPPASGLISGGELSIKNSVWYDYRFFGDGDSTTLENQFRDNPAYANEAYVNATPAVPLAEVFVEVNYGDAGFPDFRPISGGNPINLDTKVGGTPPNDGFFDVTATFLGAVSANDPTPWWQGWTDFSQF